MKYWLRILPAVLAAFLATAPIGPAHSADSYPSKPITLVAVFGPGSASDTICRVIAQPLSIALNENVIVENRPGANGALAAQYVARSAPDGYTLLMATNSPLSAVPFMMKSPPYDAVKDFTPITRMGSFTLMLVVHPSIPATNMKELIEYAKDHPGKLSFASANTSGIVAGETLKHWAEIDMLHVPYKSAPPTMDEAGVTGFDMDSWAAIVAPAGVPPEIVTRLNTELRKIIDSPEVKKTLGHVGFEAFSSTPGELGDTIKVQLNKWGKMVKDAGIQPD